MSAQEDYVDGFLKEPPWHVQVNDPASPHHGTVMQVAAFRDEGGWQAKGLNVRFFIGYRDGKPDAVTGIKEKIPYAVGVYPLPYPSVKKK